MENQVFIHVGLHKTGTSFWQKQVFPFLEDIHYHDRVWIQNEDAFNQLMLADASLYQVSPLQDIIQSWPSGRHLLSSESLSGKPQFFHAINRTMIANRLKDLFPDACILLFLRGQRQMLWSIYNQYIKSRDTASGKVEDFFWYPGKAENDPKFLNRRSTKSEVYYDTSGFQLHLDVFKYKELLDLYKNLFPRVEVFLFEDFEMDQQGTLDRMLQVLEVDLPKHKIPPLENRENASLSLRSTEIKRKVNALNGLLPKAVLKLFNAGLQLLHPPVSGAYQLGYIDFIAKDYYQENNKALIQAYPELGIDRYPEHYDL